jgi:hypothetical protein
MSTRFGGCCRLIAGGAGAAAESQSYTPRSSPSAEMGSSVRRTAQFGCFLFLSSAAYLEGGLHGGYRYGYENGEIHEASSRLSEATMRYLVVGAYLACWVRWIILLDG